MQVPVRIGKTIDADYMARGAFETLREPGTFMIPLETAEEMLADAEWQATDSDTPRSRRAYRQLADQIKTVLAALRH